MVYDPVRDCDVPSPAASEYGRGQSYFSPSVVTPTGNGQGSLHRTSVPPGFSNGPDTMASPSGGSRVSLGNLLVERPEDGLDRRRSSGRTSSFSSTGQPEDARERKASISMLLNEGGGQSSPHAHGYLSPASHRSPSTYSRPLNNGQGFAVPAPPLAHSIGQLSAPAMSPSQSHSPIPYHTPGAGQASSPAFHSYTPLPEQHYATTPGSHTRPLSRGESTGPRPDRRPSSSTGSMMPPQHIDLSSPSLHHSRLSLHTPTGRDFDQSLVGPSPSSSQLPLRSPSVSISPRSASVNLPLVSSRPGSSKGYTPQPQQHIHVPTNPYSSRSRSPSRAEDAPLRSARSISGSSSRSASAAENLYVPRPSVSPVKKSRIPYKPSYYADRRPIYPSEIARLQEEARRNNPLRTRPSRSSAGPLSAHSSQPAEDAQSYFPTPTASRPSSSGHRQEERYSPSGPPSPRQRSPAVGNGHRRKREAEPVEDQPDQVREEQRRKVSASGDFVAERAKLVAQHYNARPEVGVENRHLSPIYGLKNFNNWIKSVLIGKFLCRDMGYRGGRAPSGRVLDIGCGKGGDLNKWSKHRIGEYVGLDIADVSVEQAQSRWNSMRGYRFPAHFFAHDCYGKPLNERLPAELTRTPFDNVTMQFCMHYAFETASKARMMLENVSRYLRPGGVFFGTIPNPDSLMERLASVPEDADTLTFGNSKYSVTFDERQHKGLYGHAYHFYLDDAVDVPEYVVQWSNFVALASEYHLKLVYKKPFNEIYDEEQANPEFKSLLTRMNVIDSAGASAMDAEQWEAATIYMGFAFEKF